MSPVGGTRDEGPGKPPGQQKVRAPESGGWDTPVMALLCPTPVPGTLRLHPGYSPSHSSFPLGKQLRGHTVLPQPCRVTATLQHLLLVPSCLHRDTPVGHTCGFGSGCMETGEDPSHIHLPSTTQLLASPAAPQCCGAAGCGSVCGSKAAGLSHLSALPSGSQTAPRITAAPVFHKDGAAEGWQETLVQPRGERAPWPQRVKEPFMGNISLSPVAGDPVLPRHRLCQAGPAVSPARL